MVTLTVRDVIDERSPWVRRLDEDRVGVSEDRVGVEFRKLGPEWAVLDRVEVGDRGRDIDRVVIGPPGVITVRTKRHPNGKVWVGARTVRVNGHGTDYLFTARHVARRATELLACGEPIDVRSAIVFVDLHEFSVQQMPVEVQVTTLRRFIGWIESLPATMGAEMVDKVVERARASNTWVS